MPQNILILEVDPALRDLMHLALQREGYNVHIFSDVERALQAIERIVPDVAIIELLLPKLNGLDVIKRCRQIPGTEAVRFIVLSSLGFQEVVQQALTLGVYDYIIKPFDTDFFIERISRVLTIAPGRVPPDWITQRDNQPF